MKAKKSCLCLTAMVLALGVGVSLGALAHSNPVLVAATDADDGHSWGLIGSFSGNSWVSDVATSSAYDSAAGTKTLSYYIPEGTAFKIRADGAWTVSIGYSDLSKLTNGTTYFEAASGTDGNAQIKTGQGGLYTFTLSGNLYNYGDKSYGISVAYATAVTHTITEYKVVNGMENTTAVATETAVEGKTFTPTDYHQKGLTFNGWFTDSDCTLAYTAKSWTADGNLYAKMTSCASTGYVYFGATGWTDVYAYSFGQSESLGAFPGTKVTTNADSVNFHDGTYQGLYRVPYYKDSGDSKIIFSNYDGTTKKSQTSNMKLVEGSYYWSGADADSTGDADKGIAAGVVYDIAGALSAVEASGEIAAKSVCGITKSVATVLVNEYDALSANTTAQGYIDAATVYTYNGSDKTTQADVTFSSLIAQLRKIASASPAITTPFDTDSVSDPMNAGTIIGIIMIGALAGLSVLFIIRKKKLGD